MSAVDKFFLAQVFKKWQQRQAEDCKVIALHPLEQVNAYTFELVSADAPERGVSRQIEIVLEISVAEISHCEAGGVDAGKQQSIVTDQSSRGMQFVPASAQIPQLCRGGGAIGRLGETLCAKHQRLIRPEYRPPRKQSRNCARLGMRQVTRDACSAIDRRLRLNCPLIDC